MRHCYLPLTTERRKCLKPVIAKNDRNIDKYAISISFLASAGKARKEKYIYSKMDNEDGSLSSLRIRALCSSDSRRRRKGYWERLIVIEMKRDGHKKWKGCSMYVKRNWRVNWRSFIDAPRSWDWVAFETKKATIFQMRISDVGVSRKSYRKSAKQSVSRKVKGPPRWGWKILRLQREL